MNLILRKFSTQLTHGKQYGTHLISIRWNNYWTVFSAFQHFTETLSTTKRDPRPALHSTWRVIWGWLLTVVRCTFTKDQGLNYQGPSGWALSKLSQLGAMRPWVLPPTKKTAENEEWTFLKATLVTSYNGDSIHQAKVRHSGALVYVWRRYCGYLSGPP